jgi:hypothetical protein
MTPWTLKSAYDKMQARDRILKDMFDNSREGDVSMVTACLNRLHNDDHLDAPLLQPVLEASIHALTATVSMAAALVVAHHALTLDHPFPDIAVQAVSLMQRAEKEAGPSLSLLQGIAATARQVVKTWDYEDGSAIPLSARALGYWDRAVDALFEVNHQLALGEAREMVQTDSANALMARTGERKWRELVTKLGEADRPAAVQEALRAHTWGRLQSTAAEVLEHFTQEPPAPMERRRGLGQ